MDSANIYSCSEPCSRTPSINRVKICIFYQKANQLISHLKSTSWILKKDHMLPSTHQTRDIELFNQSQSTSFPNPNIPCQSILHEPVSFQPPIRTPCKCWHAGCRSFGRALVLFCSRSHFAPQPQCLGQSAAVGKRGGLKLGSDERLLCLR